MNYKLDIQINGFRGLLSTPDLMPYSDKIVFKNKIPGFTGQFQSLTKELNCFRVVNQNMFKFI